MVRRILNRPLHRRRHVPAPGHEHCRAERGVTVVEFSFVALMLLTVVAGTVDYGRAWQSGMAINEATRTGARVGSGQAAQPNADYNALTGIRASLVASNKIDDVELVVIYKSTTANGAVPASCTGTSGWSGSCNVFTGPQLVALGPTSFNITWAVNPSDPPTGGTGCANAGAAQYRGWCPNTRSNTQASADYYGVYIRYRQRNLFPILGTSRLMSRTAVMRLEPPSV
jgi:Flp pilus assembly protein TadG